MNSRILAGIIVLLSIPAAPFSLAQTGSGSIQGTITDSTAAVMPNATVALEHVQTANKFEGLSNAAGFFVFPTLQTGEYRMTVTATVTCSDALAINMVGFTTDCLPT